MIYRRYMRTKYSIEYVARYLITNFGRAHKISVGEFSFVCPPIGQEFEIRDPLEYRDPVSQEKKVLQSGEIYRVIGVDDRDPRIHVLLEKFEDTEWVFFGLCYLLDKKSTGMLDWHAIRPPLKESVWAREQRLLEYEQHILKSQLPLFT